MKKPVAGLDILVILPAKGLELAGGSSIYMMVTRVTWLVTKEYTRFCWLLLDIESVGPRDDQEPEEQPWRSM